MYQKAILFFLWLLVVISAVAQVNTVAPPQRNAKNNLLKIRLTGRITDEKTGESLPGASVYLADYKAGTAADTSGHYILHDIPPGHHIIEVSHAGYNTQVVHLELQKDMVMDFALSPLVLENQGVIITGVSGATSIRKTPVPVTAIRKSDLLQSASSNLIDALTRVPGVAQLSSGPAVSKPFIRGLGYNRVVVVNEGIRQEGQQWGDEHGIEIDELSIGRAEVLKGPASIMYGSDAIAGVINFITNIPVPEGTVKANVLTNYQSNNGLLAINGNIAGNKKGLNWNAYSTYKSAGDYRNNYDGSVLNSRFNEKNAGGYIGINKSWGYSHFIVSRFDQQLGLVEGERDNATGKFILFAGTPSERVATAKDLDSRKFFVPHQRVQHNKFILDNNFSIRGNRLKINLGYQENRRQEYGDPEHPSEKQLDFDLGTFNYTIQWQFPHVKEWHITAGLSGMQQQNQNKGNERIIPEYDLFDIGGFVYTQRLFKKTTLSGGIRFDNRSIDSKGWMEAGIPKFTAFNRNFSNFSGSIGISYEPTPVVTLKANIARGFRSPSLAELSSNGEHEGTNRYEYGNRFLQAETSLQFDGGLDLHYEHISFSVSAFYNRMDHFIFYRNLLSARGGDSLVPVNGDLIPAFQFDQQPAKLAGFEASFDIHPHPLDWLHVENSFSFVRGNFDKPLDGSDDLPLIPAPRFITELRADLKKGIKQWHNLYFKLETEKTFSQEHPFTGYGTETATKGYLLMNAGAGADLLNKRKHMLCSIHLSLANIFDKSYQSHLSRLKYTDVNLVTGRKGVFNTGRNFSLKLNIPLEFSLK